MKPFELTLIYRNDKKILTYDEIKGDDLVELFAQLLLVIARVQKIIEEDQKRYNLNDDDDIPF